MYGWKVDENELSHAIIGAAIEVHRNLGPGLLESVYEDALSFELRAKGFQVQQQKEQPVVYKGVQLGNGFRIDLLVNDLVVVEIKAVEKMLAVREAQLHTYLKLSDKKLGLLLNFNSTAVASSVRRVVNKL
jgi:GxxExxY protein